MLEARNILLTAYCILSIWRAIYFWNSFRCRLWNIFWVPGSPLVCFFRFSALPAPLLFLLLCFPCFSAFPASLLFLLLCFFCFFASPASLLFCYCASVPFYLYYSSFSFLQSCVFAAPLPAPLLLYFLSSLSLCFSCSFAFFVPVCIPNEALERPQVKPKETLKKT